MNGTHSPSCKLSFLDCASLANHERQAWFRKTRVLSNCDALNDKNKFQFGMFADAFLDHVSSSRFFQKYFYCLWWGLKNLRYICVDQCIQFSFSISDITYNCLFIFELKLKTLTQKIFSNNTSNESNILRIVIHFESIFFYICVQFIWSKSSDQHLQRGNIIFKFHMHCWSNSVCPSHW